MDCRTFRKKHVAFVDDTLPGIEVVSMQRHTLECEACARHDATVRRSLLLFRNLPSIEPSRDFSSRLNARLAAESIAAASRLPAPRGPGLGTFMVAAASVVAVGYLAAATLEWNEPAQTLALAPVVATRPEPTFTPMATPALVMSVSAGMPVWPVMFMAEQAPLHFAETQFTRASLGR
jgi:hypothetical protein